MIFWLTVILLLVAVVGAVAWPLLRGQSDARDEADFDIEVFRDQLAEVDREHQEGRLDYAEAEAAKAEISRRILAADAARRANGVLGNQRQPITGVVLAVVLAGTTVAAYLYIGSPDQPAQPYAEREEERKQRTAQRPANQQMDLASLAERLRQRLRQDETSVQGWQLLARTYMTMGNFEGAIPAFERLIALESADAGTYAAYGEAITLAARGAVTPKSQSAFREALAKDAKEPTSRFYLGLADWQGGEYRKAYDRWIALMAETPADASWAGVLQQRLTQASEKLGLDVAALPKPLPPAAPQQSASAQRPGGPSQEDVASAQQMLPKERQEMIRGMVDGLAAKLEENPANFEGWMRLIRSYAVLGETDKAKDALEKASAQFAKAPFVKRQLQGLARELGLSGDTAPSGSETASSAPRGPSAEDMRAAQEMSPEDQREMIEGMVSGLAARLEENPNDLQGWIRLARSYNVLRKPDAARDAMAKAAQAAPDNVDILTLYARTIRSAAGNKPTATSVEVMQKVLTLQPDNVEALFFSGLAASGAGDKAEARRLWEKAKSGLAADSPERAALDRQIQNLDK